MWQGDLWIGKKVRNREEARTILKQLSPSMDLEGDNIYKDIEKSINYKGNDIKIRIGLNEEAESGGLYDNAENTNAMVGFKITSPYLGSILDKDCEHGRPEPFVIDVEDLMNLIVQVRKWWKDANVLIWTNFY